MRILSAEGLSKTYGAGATAVHALDGISLSVSKGEFVAVVGSSGSGKSTLLHLLGGLDRPTAGKAWLDGHDLTVLSEEELTILRRRKIGFIFQHGNLIPILTAEENAILPLLLDQREVDWEYIADLLRLLGLEERRQHMPGALSGGQQQRVAIARALAGKPALILADEPTGNLDSRTAREVLDLLRLSMRRYNQTLVMITHDPGVAAAADRRIRIEDGRIAMEGTVLS